MSEPVDLDMLEQLRKHVDEHPISNSAVSAYRMFLLDHGLAMAEELRAHRNNVEHWREEERSWQEEREAMAAELRGLREHHHATALEAATDVAALVRENRALRKAADATREYIGDGSWGERAQEKWERMCDAVSALDEAKGDWE